jgi:hypothetical protein
MDNLQVGDVVTYIDDWKPNRQWYLYSLHGNGQCTIVIIRDGKITNVKGNEEMLNASIVNLDINKIKRT